MRRRVAVAGCLGAVMLTGCVSTSSGVTATQRISLEGPTGGRHLPTDDRVKISTLDNGLTVYIRKNLVPGDTAEMRLVIDAGSAQEDADQSGTAHFLEHMLFNGTESYPANELVDTLQGFGMAFGADINAYTSFDETVYQLSVPTADDENLATGIDVLAEWLDAATLADDQVVAERGVVLDEWRQSHASMQGRALGAVEELLLSGTKYDGRDPIGTNTAISAMTAERLRRFYEEWYRPDNAAIVIVGDVSPSQVLKQVKKRFGSIERPPVPLASVSDLTVELSQPRAIVHQDPDAVDAYVEFGLPAVSRWSGVVGGRRESTAVALAFDIVATRLSDDLLVGLQPLLSAGVSSQSLVRSLHAPVVTVAMSAEHTDVAVLAVIEEFERLHRFGVQPGELARVIAGARTLVETAHGSADLISDREYADAYVANALDSSPIPSSADLYELDSTILDEMTVEIMNEVIERRFQASAPHVLVVGPTAAESFPTAGTVLTELLVAASRPMNPRVDIPFTVRPLMDAPAPVNEVSTRSMIDEPEQFLTADVITFDNGVRLILNANDSGGETVALSASRPGGLSVVADEDVPAALLATQVYQTIGLGDLDPVALQTSLDATSVELSAVLGQTSAQWWGLAPTDELETVFQMLHLSMTAPRFDRSTLDRVILGWRPYVADPTRDPDLASSMALNVARYGPDTRFHPLPSIAQLDAVDIEAVQRVWSQQFAPSAGWTFVISGPFDTDDVLYLARRYIGSLPAGSPPAEWVDLQSDPPRGIVTTDVVTGTGQQAAVRQLYTSPAEGSADELVAVDALSIVLSSRLVDHVREELGASYSPYARVTVHREPDAIVEVYVDVSGDPSQLERLSDVVRAELRDLYDHGPTEQDLSEAVAELERTYGYYYNAQLADLLLAAADRPTVLHDYISRDEVLAGLTVDSLAQLARRALTPDRFIEVRVHPA